MFHERLVLTGGSGGSLARRGCQLETFARASTTRKRFSCAPVRLACPSGGFVRRGRAIAAPKAKLDNADERVVEERPADSFPESGEVGPSPECEGRSLEAKQANTSWFPSISLLSVAGGGALASGSSLLSTPASFAEAIGILALIVAVHEAGHFIAARAQNIHVTKFAIGFGPPLLTYQGQTVEYSIRAFPLGGFVGFPDDDPSNPYPPDDPDLFSNRPIAQRALVISAGVLANLAFAFSILFTQVTTVGVATESYQTGVKVGMVFENSIAQRSGLQPGDLILGIDGRILKPGPRAVSEIVNEINTHPGSSLSLLVQQKDGGPPVPIPVIPDPGRDGKGRVGMQLEANKKLSRRVAQDLGEAVSTASTEFVSILKDMIAGLQQIVFNFSKTSEQVSGPVAIVAVGAEVARLDAAQLFTFAAVINMNLAVVNILPLPALDGGYLALLILEALRGGKRLPEKVEQGVMASGLLFLMVVGLGLVVRDTVNLGILNNFPG